MKVMANLTENTKRSMFYPFHKDGWKVTKQKMVMGAIPRYIIVW